MKKWSVWINVRKTTSISKKEKKRKEKKEEEEEEKSLKIKKEKRIAVIYRKYLTLLTNIGFIPLHQYNNLWYHLLKRDCTYA